MSQLYTFRLKNLAPYHFLLISSVSFQNSWNKKELHSSVDFVQVIKIGMKLCTLWFALDNDCLLHMREFIWEKKNNGTWLCLIWNLLFWKWVTSSYISFRAFILCSSCAEICMSSCWWSCAISDSEPNETLYNSLLN